MWRNFFNNTISNQLGIGIRGLRNNDYVQDPYRDAAELLAYVLDQDIPYLITHHQRRLWPSVVRAYQSVVERRAQGEPLGYITNSASFYGRNYYVDRRVLLPRPETEELMELVLSEQDSAAPISSAVDVGTGCGCIAVTLALELPKVQAQPVRLYATDLSADALTVAKHNAKLLQCAEQITFLQGNLLDPVGERLDLIVANLPYLRPGQLQEPTILREPTTALAGGDDGMRVIKQLIASLPERLNFGGRAYFEIGHDQAAELTKLASATLPQATISVRQDLANVNRFLVITT